MSHNKQDEIMDKTEIDIRWHGRGGQGAITAAKIVAGVAFASGFPGVAMIPTFGTERRGAPVFTSLKLSKEEVYDLSPIEQPDIVVVLDERLFDEAGAASGIKPGGRHGLVTGFDLFSSVRPNDATAPQST